MNTYMVIARFKPDTDMQQVYTVRDQEIAMFEALKKDGRLGSLHTAVQRGTVFIEVFATDEQAAEDTVQSLPMAKFWTLDIYPTPAPPPAGTKFG